MHILLTNVHLDCRGEGSSNRNASRDESVETGDESVETGDVSIEAGEKTPQSCYNIYLAHCHSHPTWPERALLNVCVRPWICRREAHNCETI